MRDATVYALDCVFVEWVNGERYGCDNKDRRYLLSVYGNIFDVSDRPKPRILLLMCLLWCGKLYDRNSSCMMRHHDVHLQSRSWQVWPQWSVCKSDGKGQQSVVFLSCKEQVASWNVDVLCRSGRAVVQGSHLGIVCRCWHCGVYKQAADSARFHCERVTVLIQGLPAIVRPDSCCDRRMDSASYYRACRGGTWRQECEIM